MTTREQFIAIVDNDSISKSEVIVLLEGDGLNRCQKAFDLLKSGWASKILFSGGICDYDYGSFPFEDVMPYLTQLGCNNSDIIVENQSKNTLEQALNVIDLAEKNNWEKLILVASHDHQYRAYLTFLKVVLEKKLNIILYNSPARNLPWFKETGWGTRFERLNAEFDRIDKYSKKGHLATFEQVIIYQEWKERQP
jgi:uncharacterized SAM-binding protein YcdF (DUF218 family)